jgi:hypothetical protein
MEIRNGKVVGAWQQRTFAYRAPFAKDYDFTQRPFRRFVGVLGGHDVQLPSGLEAHKWQGIRYPYRGAGWLWGFATPIVPGQMRYTGAGAWPKPASTSQLQSLWNATVGMSPDNPAGTGPPGQFYGQMYDMPGTG